ncbi:hypothetical protein SDC9_48134 [bioreactor metagenome]|uniref:Uncharacterized protein n=1 Tax=bioreactor metagenome TaxID=1076179 RepID=A0A644WHX9_9ZZZZ
MIIGVTTVPESKRNTLRQHLTLTGLKRRKDKDNMRNYLSDGANLRLQIKSLVLEYMKSASVCAPDAKGIRQAEIFRACGLDWGEQPNATSSNQQY